MPGLRFLVHLRQQNAAAADQRYAALLARAANAPNTNANTVSLLSSYIFTPGLFMVISPGGGLATYSSDRQPPVDAPELRLAFLNFAAQILMRPLPPLAQENAKGRRTGIYLVTSRLLPLFEQFAPEHIGVLRAQIAAVTADVSEETRDPRNPWLSRGLTPANQEGDESETALERAEKAKTPEQRDSLYAVAALSLVHKEPARAYDIADKISDSQLRQQLRSYLDFTSLGRALNQKNPTEALRLARKGDLTNIQRVWGLTEAAKLLVKTDRAQAVAILEEAALETRRISGADASRVSGLVAVATYFYELDRARAWEFVNEAIKAANSNDDYSGEDSYIQSGVRAKNFASLNNSSVESFDLQGLFRLLAKEDMNRAVQAAKSFTRDAPRANALFAVARQTLAKPDKNREVRQSEQVVN